jgi:hypothetical protein
METNRRDIEEPKGKTDNVVKMQEPVGYIVGQVNFRNRQESQG